MTTLNEQIARMLHPNSNIKAYGNRVVIGEMATQLPNYAEDLNAAWELLPLFKNQFTAKAAVEAALNFGLQPSQVARQICEALLTEAENGE